MKHYNVILATDKSHCIGLDNGLPWDFDMDMKHFANMTKTSARSTMLRS